jgi:hypothetical protein
MKAIACASTAVLFLALGSAQAQAQGSPGGCLKYGLGGAVAGHFAGGHTVKGALAGCLLGMARRRQYEQQVQQQRRRPNDQIARERARELDRSAERRPDPQRVDRVPRRIPEEQRADRLPNDRTFEQRVDRFPGDRSSEQRVDRPRRAPERSPYEDLGLGRNVPQPAPRQEAGRSREPSGGPFENGGAFSRAPVDPSGRSVDTAPTRRQRPVLEPEETGSFLRGNSGVY